MFLVSQENDQLIPHRQNISRILDQNPFISFLRKEVAHLNPTICGGYAAALLLAPRTGTKLSNGYYSDIDIYARHSLHIKPLRRILDRFVKTFSTSSSIYNTDRATTFHTFIRDEYVKVQLIEHICGEPVDILKTFDFVNCAIGFSPVDRTIYMHKDLVTHHCNKVLEILHPWMLYEASSQTQDNVVVQLLRFKKYCLRWGYTLSSEAFALLVEIYNKFPNLVVKKHSNCCGVGSGYENYVALESRNVWSIVAPLLKNHALWHDCMDPHGFILDGDKELTAEALFFNKGLARSTNPIVRLFSSNWNFMLAQLREQVANDTGAALPMDLVLADARDGISVNVYSGTRLLAKIRRVVQEPGSQVRDLPQSGSAEATVADTSPTVAFDIEYNNYIYDFR